MRIIITFFNLLLSITSYSQKGVDSSLLFEMAKGLLNQPLTTFIKLPQPKDLEMVSYITKNPDSVRAIFDGKIVSIAEVGDSYLLMTTFGNYSIAYYGLSKPSLKEGNLLKRNQFISTLSKNSFGQFFLTIQFYKGIIEINPNEWFK